MLYFWTSTNYESLNHLAFLNDIFVTYKDQGLSIIGIHVPKMEFEKDPAVLTRLLNRYNLLIPVLQDNQGEALQTYFVTDIPWLILIDRLGRIRATLMPPLSQVALMSRISDLITESDGAALGTLPEDLLKPLEGPFSSLKFNFGYKDLAFFGNFTKVRSEEVQDFAFPDFIQPNLFYIEGGWRFQRQLAEILSEKAKVRFYFQGAVLSLVAEAPQGTTREVQIRIDHKPLSKELFGPDTSRNGDETVVKINEPRIYTILSLPAPLKEAHEVELTVTGGMTYLYGLTSSDMPMQYSTKKSEDSEEEDGELKLSTTLEAD